MLTGDYTIDGKNLMPADIAVLVRSNKQAAIVKSSLSSAGIPAVTRSSESVFLSAEAMELYFIFSAILNPADQRRLRTALSTVICGYTAGQVALMAGGSGTADGIDHDESVSSRFYSYREAWGRGFMDMFIMFMEGEGVASRLFAYSGGGRSMANIIHVAELLADESVSGRLTPADTLARLSRYIADPPEGDQYSMRLETDEEAVNVMTMHSSKGLEFPVVFCPYCVP
jgi:exodeoxyribonuclease V beta subunit